MARIVGFKVRVIRFEPEMVIDEILAKGASGLNNVVLPHLLEVAQSRAPVGKDRDSGKNFNKPSFEPVRLAKPGTFGSALSSENVSAGVLEELRGLTSRQRTRAVVKTFGTRTRSPKATKYFRGTGANKGKTPTELRLIGGTIRGAFAHKGGTLKGSHKMIPARREGNRVIGGVQATAKHAAAVHNGFTHKGGRGHTGAATKIAPRPWLKQSLENVKEDLTNPATYKG